MWKIYNIPKIEVFLYALAAGITCPWVYARATMGGGAVGVGFMVSPQRGRGRRRRNPFSAAHPCNGGSMALIITAIISFFFGAVSMIYFLRYFANFDFLPAEKDPKK